MTPGAILVSLLPRFGSCKVKTPVQDPTSRRLRFRRRMAGVYTRAHTHTHKHLFTLTRVHEASFNFDLMSHAATDGPSQTATALCLTPLHLEVQSPPRLRRAARRCMLRLSFTHCCFVTISARLRKLASVLRCYNLSQCLAPLPPLCFCNKVLPDTSRPPPLGPPIWLKHTTAR